MCVRIHTHACIKNRCEVYLRSAFISSPRLFEFHTGGQRPNLVANDLLGQCDIKKNFFLSAYL